MAPLQPSPPARAWAMTRSKDMRSGMAAAAAAQSSQPSRLFRISRRSSSSSGVVWQMYVRTAPSMSPRTSLSPTRCVTGLTDPNLCTPK